MILETLQAIATPAGLIYIFGGAVLGMLLGAIPGLSGGTITILLLPISYKMNPALALGLFTSIYIGSTSGGCIGSILLGIPGTNSSIVTTFDGYPLTKKGEPVRALSAAVSSNFIAMIPSLIIAIIAAPLLAKLAVKLGPWEYFALCLCAIAMVVGLSKENASKGLLAVGLAIIAASVGMAPISSTQRFTFGNLYLFDGFSIVNIMMGMFAAKIILQEFASGKKAKEASNIKVSGFKLPVRDLLNNVGNIIRSFFTGLIIGFLPGLGGKTSTFLAYSTERNLSKNKENWGKGEIGGVIAPEVANNAGIGGELIPLIALGIPGSTPMTLFLAALTIHGINPGPLLIRNNPEIVYMIYIAAIIAAVLILIVEIVGMPIFPRMLKAPYHYLYPLIIIISLLGAFLCGNSLYGLFITLVACLMGLAMDYFGIPIVPFIMTFILSPLLEKNLRMALNYSDTGFLSFLTRPVSAILLVIAAAVLIWNLIGHHIKPKKTKETAGTTL